MVSFFKRKTDSGLGAAADGRTLALEEVKDPVFADKTLGEGIAIAPHNDVVAAPCTGKVVSIPETKHAFSILGEDGMELLVHIGIDTVALKGEGFTQLVEEGGDIKKGEPVIRFERELMEQKGIDTTVITIVLNYQEYELKQFHIGKDVNRGETVIEYTVI